MSKQFTAFAIMLLYDDRKIVSQKRIPGFSKRTKTITAMDWNIIIFTVLTGILMGELKLYN
ncbi:hypothetical protein J2TS4_27790 [Paenibacillus sp. J2TS4]|nr:hypothetical protein J2TS4_27790 [Paenibacillus sp. J2TS4]